MNLVRMHGTGIIAWEYASASHDLHRSVSGRVDTGRLTLRDVSCASFVRSIGARIRYGLMPPAGRKLQTWFRCHGQGSHLLHRSLIGDDSEHSTRRLSPIC
jgi:hypothetical protein